MVASPVLACDCGHDGQWLRLAYSDQPDAGSAPPATPGI